MTKADELKEGKQEGAVCMSLVLDRISILENINKEKFAAMLSNVWSHSGEDGVKVWKSKFRTHASLPLGAHATLRIELGMSHHNLYLKFDFQPPQLGAEEIEKLNGHLLFPYQFSHGDFQKTTKVSYAEFAVDCKGASWKDHIIFDKTLKSSIWWPSPVHICKTLYLGRKGANRVVRGYDRQKKLADVNHVHVDGPLTRIEAVCRRTCLAPATLHQMHNPFASVGVVNIDAALQSFADEKWINFVYQCLKVGPQYALWKLPAEIREKFLGRLEECIVPWWKPAQIWQQVGGATAMLNGLGPQYVAQAKAEHQWT